MAAHFLPSAPLSTSPPPCTLRPLVSADAESLAHHANDHEVWKSMRDRFPHPYSAADARAFITHVEFRSVRTTFGIVVDDQAIGAISLMLGEDVSRRTAEVGYWIGREFWGRGIMVHALRAMTQYAFAQLDLDRVFALPLSRTTRSVRVLEKVGYELEGVMRHSAVKEGILLDQLLYAAYADRPLR